MHLKIKIYQIFLLNLGAHKFCPIIGNTHNQLILYLPDKNKKGGGETFGEVIKTSFHIKNNNKYIYTLTCGENKQL